MADPVFVSSLAVMKQSLRLSGVPTGSDADVMVQSALMQVRAGFYSRLGLARVAALVAISSVANPTTNDGILRGIAEETEVMWTRCLLLDRLPLQFMDSSGAEQEILNQEGTTRSMSAEVLREQKLACKAQIEEWLDILSGDVELGDVGSGRVHTQGDQTPRMFPNGTLGGANKRLFGDPTREIT